jgi:hypothetical protein
MRVRSVLPLAFRLKMQTTLPVETHKATTLSGGAPPVLARLYPTGALELQRSINATHRCIIEADRTCGSTLRESSVSGRQATPQQHPSRTGIQRASVQTPVASTHRLAARSSASPRSLTNELALDETPRMPAMEAPSSKYLHTPWRQTPIPVPPSRGSCPPRKCRVAAKEPRGKPTGPPLPRAHSAPATSAKEY